MKVNPGRSVLAMALLCALVTACGAGSTSQTPTPTTATSSQPATATGSPVPTSGATSASAEETPSVNPPKKAFVSTTAKGKEFDAIPFFELFAACERPCWLPVYPDPKFHSEGGASVTNGWPCEYYDMSSIARGPFCADHNSSKGDKVHVKCQKEGNNKPNEGRIRNDNGVSSNLWDRIEIPKEMVVKGADLLTPMPNGKGYYGYVSDLWLGNTGSHGIHCQAR